MSPQAGACRQSVADAEKTVLVINRVWFREAVVHLLKDLEEF